MKGTGRIINGELRLEKKFLDFLLLNEDSEVDVELVVLNKPEHYLYKYLWGYLYDDMASFMQEDKYNVHDMMKEMFAKGFVDEWDEVPRRHRKKCERYERVHDNGAVERWYVMSTSSMNHEEMKEYIQRVEYHYFDFLSGGSKDNGKIKEGYHLRVKGMMDEKQLKKHLKENI